MQEQGWDIITNLLNLFSSCSNRTEKTQKTHKPKQPVFNKKKTQHSGISMMSDISDSQIQTENMRKRYIYTVKNPDYKIKKGDVIDDISKKFGVEICTILDLNKLDADSAKRLKPDQVIKIPPTRKVRNVYNLNDAAKALGVSVDFIKKLKKVEDSGKLADNQFHNTPYTDDAGVVTIGIGHAVKKGDPKYLSNSQVCDLLVKDMLKFEENLCSLMGGKAKYDKLPQPIKEALLCLTFNKGPDVVKNTPGLLYTLKVGKYEASINLMALNYKSTNTGLEMSGLCKRRLFELSIASKIYKGGKIPQSNINTAQHVYNHGVNLLRAECRKSGKKFENMIVGYNNDVKSYLGDRIRLITK